IFTRRMHASNASTRGNPRHMKPDLTRSGIARWWGVCLGGSSRLLPAVAWMGVLLYGGLAHARPEITLEAAEDRVVLANAVQRVVLAKGDDGTFALTTEIRDDEAWRPWFDAGLPVIQGEDFALKPTRYRIPVH